MAERQLTYEQVFELLYKAGWRKSGDIERAATIVQAESSRIPTRENYCCVGLMAINVLVHRQYTREQMKDPEANVRAGFALWQARGNWADWNASRGGQILAGPLVRAHLATWNVSKVPGQVGSAVGGAVKDAVPGLSGLVQASEKVRRWVATPANLGRLVIGVIGLVVIVAGFTVLAKPAIDYTAKTVGEVKPI